MDNIIIPILVVMRVGIDDQQTHSSDDWLLTIPTEIRLMLKRMAAVFLKNAYRKKGKRKIKTCAFPQGKIIFGSWTNNKEKAGYVGIYWSIEPANENFESLMTGVKSRALEFSKTLVPVFMLLKEYAGTEAFPGACSFFTNNANSDISEELALAVRLCPLENDAVFDVIQPEGNILKVWVPKTRRPAFKRDENLEEMLRNITADGPLSLSGQIHTGAKKETIKVEYPESIKIEIFDILKSGRDWNFEFEVYHEFINGVAKITKLHVVKIIGPSCQEDFAF